MIIATSQDYALVAADCCPCLPPEAPAPRRECQSRSITLTSEGYFKPEGEAAWMIYQTRTYAQSASASGSESGDEITFGCVFSNSYSGSWTRTDVYSYSGTINWFGLCLDDGSQSAGITDCTDNLTESRSISRTCTDSEDNVYLQEDYTYSRTRSKIAGQPNPEHADWEIAAAEWDAADPEVREGDRPEEPAELYPDCTFQDSVTETFTNMDGNVDGYPTTYDPGGLAGLSPPSYVTNYTQSNSETYGGGIGYAAWVASANALAEEKLTFAGDLDSSCLAVGCASIMTVTPEPVAPEPVAPEEGDPPPPAPTAPKATLLMLATKARYRIGIPADYADRTYYAWQGDEVFFPAEWEAWKALKDAFDAAEAAHADWVAAGSDGEEPEIPDDPGAAPTPAPSLVATRSWTYDGTDEFSPWFEIAIPTIPGETRLVNQLARHYRSTRLGNKPTAFGEVYEF